MKIGALYQSKSDYWFLYSSHAEATVVYSRAGCLYAITEFAAKNETWYWSKVTKCNISYIKPNSVFVLLEYEANYWKILTAEGTIGWISGHSERLFEEAEQ
jgi:hypothetical protein